jgi:glutaconate CoA-transferase subunit A
MGVPYVPVLGLVGTDLLRNREDMKVLPDPFDPSRKTVVARSYRPGICLLHALRADAEGNVDLGRPTDDVLLAEASARVIVSVEEIVERVERPAHGGFLTGILVDHVVLAPFGAHPAGCPGRYPVDEKAIRQYVYASQSEASFAEYLEATSIKRTTNEDYLEHFVRLDWQRAGGAPMGAQHTAAE